MKNKKYNYHTSEWHIVVPNKQLCSPPVYIRIMALPIHSTRASYFSPSSLCGKFFLYFLLAGTKIRSSLFNVARDAMTSRVAATISPAWSGDVQTRSGGNGSTPSRTPKPFIPTRWLCRESSSSCNTAASVPRRGGRRSIAALIPKRRTISPKRWYTSTRARRYR